MVDVIQNEMNIHHFFCQSARINYGRNRIILVTRYEYNLNETVYVVDLGNKLRYTVIGEECETGSQFLFLLTKQRIYPATTHVHMIRNAIMRFHFYAMAQSGESPGKSYDFKCLKSDPSGQKMAFRFNSLDDLEAFVVQDWRERWETAEHFLSYFNRMFDDMRGKWFYISDTVVTAFLEMKEEDLVEMDDHPHYATIMKEQGLKE